MAASKKKDTTSPQVKPDLLQQQAIHDEPFRPLAAVEQFSLFTPHDIYLFKEGRHFRLYEKFGAHAITYEGVQGTYFAVWAPNAAFVSVIGDFNEWDPHQHTLFVRWDESGIWEGFIPGMLEHQLYKFYIRSNNGQELRKADPYAFHAEKRPHTASITTGLDYTWHDGSWMKHRPKHNSLQSPFSVYEVHLASWRRPDAFDRETFYNYREIAHMLVPYVQEMGFTHIELLPIMEHPLDASWGYQITGYFAPTSRYGSPQDFMYFVDYCHQHNIGVLLDWVPSHFPYDDHGLYKFDGEHTYEYADMRRGFHPDWNSYIFNYGRSEVKSFLISNALYWLDKYHIDGLRVDAVASMIQLDYSRGEGQWEPNQYGGNDHLEAIQFLKELNTAVYQYFPGVQTIAEESSTYDGITRPVHLGGVGFGMKWMMGWMNDTLKYFKRDAFFRKWHQSELTFSIMYAFKENFMLPLSHDEVVHGKSPILYKMPGDDWQKFANVRLLYGYMFTHPGTKLLFMGNEFGVTHEWNDATQLNWTLLQYESHQGLQRYVKALNNLYKAEPSLHTSQFDPLGFQWLSITDHEHSIIIYIRKSKHKKDTLLIALNMTPIARHNYHVTVPLGCDWTEILNSDDTAYFGGGVINKQVIQPSKGAANGVDYTIAITIPPLGVSILKPVAG
ncbi:1,4-alpha-glucan branching enzyme [Chitinophaga skermanii]|uniref:1,4-alpha-glucan branching enzyme GlgB n=1 Tax=Chitinophaga skermanii TaxID=331697 RepID=A0A327QLB6_9BACT|nr:1,4-alpha-glucan branching protein GlgB [Chitinophaga skermanii]RAJ05339.1 1,4-alpha-glucan branching enzyme [Chitinophaga skermanii]